MKKIGRFLASLALALSLTACGNSESSGGVSAPSPIQSGSNRSGSSSVVSSAGSSSASSSAESSSGSSSSSSSRSSSSSEASNFSSSSLNSSASSSGSSSSRQAQSSSEPAQSSLQSVQSSSQSAQSRSKPEISEPEPAKEKTLVVYFTWSSNTEKMADTIIDLTGADVFELVPVNPYPEAYTPCTEVALKERDSNARPAIKDLPASVSEYDNIIIGYPIWWHTAPMIIGTFLEHYDLSGIDVYPFTQSASMNTEQFDQSMEFVRGCAKNAAVHDGLFARYSDTNSIKSYIERNGLAK